MNKISRFLSQYFKFVLLGRNSSNQPRRIIDINEVNIEPSEPSLLPPPPSSENSETQTKIKLIVQINRLLMVVCGLSFLFILIYPFIYPDKSVPDLIQNAFFTTLGWFGGALGAFFQVDQDRQS